MKGFPPGTGKLFRSQTHLPASNGFYNQYRHREQRNVREDAGSCSVPMYAVWLPCPFRPAALCRRTELSFPMRWQTADCKEQPGCAETGY